MIVGYDVELSRESRDLLLPKRGKTAESGDEEHGEPDPLPLVIERALASDDSRHRPANPTRMAVGITAIGVCQTATLQATPAAFNNGYNHPGACLKFDTQPRLNLGQAAVDWQCTCYTFASETP